MQAEPQFARPTTLTRRSACWPRASGGSWRAAPTSTRLWGQDRSPNPFSISRLSSIRGIGVSDGIVRIGGATTWSDLIAADLPSGSDGPKAAARGRFGPDPESGNRRRQHLQRLAGGGWGAAITGARCPVELRSAKGLRVVRLRRLITGNRLTPRAPMNW